MRNIHARYGYNHETTASDSSNMNGIIDRPHLTIKKRHEMHILHIAGVKYDTLGVIL
jgi:hypothetical protein